MALTDRLRRSVSRFCGDFHNRVNVSAHFQSVIPRYLALGRVGFMLTKCSIETLLVDEGLAGQVWELWNAGVITDGLALLSWLLIAASPSARRAPICRPLA